MTPRRSPEQIKALRGQAFELCGRKGASHEAAAELLGISSTTVGRYLRDYDVPARWNALSAAALDARRDQVVELYALGNSERAIGTLLGWSYETIRCDLKIKGIPRRPRKGLHRHDVRTPERMRVRDDGYRRHRAEVKRLKRERGLIDTRELLKRLRSADVPRLEESIRWRVEAGQLERARDLPFDKPWLFTPAAADELIAQLRADERYERWNRHEYRAAQVKSQFGLKAARREGGRANVARSVEKGTRLGRPRGSKILTREVQELILAHRAAGLSDREIARKIHASEATVRRFKPAAS